MRYVPESRPAVHDPTVIVNAAVASFALTASVQPAASSAWMARMAFAGAVLTILLRRFTWGRPVRLLPKRRREMYGETTDGDPLDTALAGDATLFV